MSRLVVAGMSIIFTLTSFAAAQPKLHSSQSDWKGSNASIGFTLNTGNTNTRNATSTINLLFQKDRWSNTTNLSAQWAKNNGVLSKDKYTIVNQLNYSFDQKKSQFIFTNINTTIDHFSAYRYVLVSSAGYGKSLIKNKRLTLSIQIGPGLRRNVIRSNKQALNHLVLTTQGNLSWAVTQSGTLTETARFDYGEPYNFYQSITAFNNKIIGDLAMQVSFEVDHYSNIPPTSTNTQKTDTTTALSLVYSF